MGDSLPGDSIRDLLIAPNWEVTCITLPEANIAPEDGWNTSFLLGRPIFKGYVILPEGSPLKGHVNSPSQKGHELLESPGVVAKTNSAARKLPSFGRVHRVQDKKKFHCWLTAGVVAVSRLHFLGGV